MIKSMPDLSLAAYLRIDQSKVKRLSKMIKITKGSCCLTISALRKNETRTSCEAVSNKTEAYRRASATGKDHRMELDVNRAETALQA